MMKFTTKELASLNRMQGKIDGVISMAATFFLENRDDNG